jgi:hypothetical protein
LAIGLQAPEHRQAHPRFREVGPGAREADEGRGGERDQGNQRDAEAGPDRPPKASATPRGIDEAGRRAGGGGARRTR